MEDKSPLGRWQLPTCFGQYSIEQPKDWRKGCRMCFVKTECVRETSGKTDHEIIYAYEDLETFKNTCYQDAIDLGLIHPTTKPEELAPIHLWKALVAKFRMRGYA